MRSWGHQNLRLPTKKLLEAEAGSTLTQALVIELAVSRANNLPVS